MIFDFEEPVSWQPNPIWLVLSVEVHLPTHQEYERVPMAILLVRNYGRTVLDILQRLRPQSKFREDRMKWMI